MPTPTMLRSFPLFVVVVLLVRSPAGAAADGGGNATADSCPLDLGYVRTFPWDPTPCAGAAPNVTACCQTLLSLFGIGLAERLRVTGNFRLPSAAASTACIESFTDLISAAPAGLSGSSLVPECFPDPSQFAITPSYCAGVSTATEFAAAVGNDSVQALNSSCGPDLASPATCALCYSTGVAATAHLTTAAANDSKSGSCFYLSVLYAAGISNSAGPTYPPTAACALGLGLSSPPPAPSKSSNVAVYAATIPIAFVLLASLFGFFLWRRKRTHANSKKKSHKICEEGGRRVLDMTAPAGPVLITDWAWTLVKAGHAREVLDEALSTAESPRSGVMERFVLVGILCAHVMVALRPTISDAVRMLEGDMDVPELPDRPLPYGHSAMFSEAGNTFSISLAFSGPLAPFIDNGDMLR
ncbi:unnamed protein product [Miscanthus lutarioriparius]|uniref:SPARK domain-containing protein n=1 Tax=Miscanthus lutarioriparius TaxID=422564 RepID=A0A811RQM8_9POAL|nr:unnamed protein product [Miscanthus lutarioriparius]